MGEVSGPGAATRSTSRMVTERGSSRIQPRAAKSARALFTVSREAPTSWASSSWVRSWCTCMPSSARSPKRLASSSNCLATRPGTSENTRSATTSLARRSRAAICAEQALSHLGAAGQPAHQLVVLQRADLRGGHRGRRARPGSRVEDRQLPEHLARTEHRQQVLPAGRPAATELDLAADHDVQPVLQVALAEQYVTLGEPDGAHSRGEGSSGLVLEAGEEGRLLQDIRVHAYLLDQPRGIRKATLRGPPRQGSRGPAG